MPPLHRDASSFIFSFVVLNNCHKQVSWHRQLDELSIVSSWGSAVIAVPAAHLLCCKLTAVVYGGQAVIKQWSCSEGEKNVVIERQPAVIDDLNFRWQ